MWSSLLLKRLVTATARNYSASYFPSRLVRSNSYSTSKMAIRDTNTLSNYNAWSTKHTTANLKIDFKDKCLRGSVVLELESLTDKESKEIILDTSYLSLSSVELDSSSPKWEVKPRSEPNGAPLHVAVPDGAAKGAIIKLVMEIATTDKCTALQWLTPAQTSNKKHPYVYSQCQAIHNRSLFPCQDTPDVKSTYTFNITSPLAVVASGVPSGVTGEAAGEDKAYHFEQKVPIPSYLFALASGDIATAKIGPRSVVATGPDEVEAAKWELERDMEKFMEAAEKLIYPYKWGEYNVLVLPPSFPYGGMENPIFTFATPTVISGDRENVDVIGHELSHSWSGNDVTSCSWEHFWLNEGWTTYLERRLAAALHGEPQFDFSSIIGWKALEDAVNAYGADHEFTKLVPKFDNTNPDDAFSSIPYEKGFHFIWYLDRLVGRETFDKFIPHYFKTWSGKSIDSYEFKATFLDFFNGLGNDEIKQKISTIDWDGHFYTPGLPPKPDFNTSMADVCYELADKWKSTDFKPSANDVEGFTANQKLVFLERVQRFEQPLTPAQSQSLGKTYKISESRNVELKSAYFLVALQAKDTSAYHDVADLLGQVGRMKFVRALFRGLNRVDRDLAVKTFEKNKDFYHPIGRSMVEKDLGAYWLV